MKIAMIAATDLPIPAFLGGATETLMTHILNENSIHQKLDITVFCYEHEQHKNYVNIPGVHFEFYKGDTLLNKLHFFLRRIKRRIFFRNINLKTNFVDFCIKKINQSNFDYVLIEGNIFQILQFKGKVKCKIIYHEHTDLLNINTHLAKKIVNSCDKIITVSQFCKNRIKEIDCSKEGIYVLKNCIDTTRFKPLNNMKFRKEFFNKNGLDEKDYLILFCGRVEERKGIKELIESLEYLDNSYKLIVVGNSWYNNKQTSKFVKKLKDYSLKFENRIIFTGYIEQKELSLYYSLADICVFPSKCNEAAGLVIIESLACGVPVIVTNVGGMPEYADESGSYIISNLNSLSMNIAQKIKESREDKTTYNAKKSNSRQIALNFSKEEYYKNFIKILED